MGAVRGVLVGALGLVVLEVAITNADSVASLIQLVGGDGHPGSGLLGRALSPDVAAIPNRAGARGTAAGAAAAGAGVVGSGGIPPQPAYPSPSSVPAPLVAPFAPVPVLPNSPNLN